ncbi:hypothetical protein VTI74DRAFT_7410 [Chaetomium olivicolor]
MLSGEDSPRSALVPAEAYADQDTVNPPQRTYSTYPISISVVENRIVLGDTCCISSRRTRHVLASRPKDVTMPLAPSALLLVSSSSFQPRHHSIPVQVKAGQTACAACGEEQSSMFIEAGLYSSVASMMQLTPYVDCQPEGLCKRRIKVCSKVANQTKSIGTLSTSRGSGRLKLSFLLFSCHKSPLFSSSYSYVHGEGHKRSPLP